MSTRMQGDTYPLTLTVGDDLTGCTAILHVHPYGEPGVLLKTIPLDITAAGSASAVECDWDATLDPAEDAATGISYWLHVEVTDSTGASMATEYDSLTVARHAMTV